MTDYDYEDFDSAIDDDENSDKEAQYQELVSRWEIELDICTENELLMSVDDFIDGFTALGDYKDSAKRAEECYMKLKEIQKQLQEEEARKKLKKEEEAPPKPEKSSFGDKCEELKSQIAALNEIIKKDEEKIAHLKNEISKINSRDPEKILKEKKQNKVAIPLTSIFGILCFIIGTALIAIGEVGTIIPGALLETFALPLLIVALALWASDKKIDVSSVESALAEKNALSQGLATANKHADEHRNELQKKQAELDRYLLGL